MMRAEPAQLRDGPDHAHVSNAEAHARVCTAQQRHGVRAELTEERACFFYF